MSLILPLYMLLCHLDNFMFAFDQANFYNEFLPDTTLTGDTYCVDWLWQ
jgi:hypothetical protein